MLSILGLESFCSFLRVRSSFASGVLIMMLPVVAWDIPKFGDIPLGSTKVPSLGLLGLVTSGLLNLQREISFVFPGFCHLCYLWALS